MQGQRGFIEIHIKIGVVLFTNSKMCFLKNIIGFHLSLYLHPLSKQGGKR